MIAPRATVQPGPPNAQGLLTIAFDNSGGPHRLCLPASEVAIIDNDVTVKNLSAILAAAIYQRMPARVQRVMVRMFEGVAKLALAMVGVAGDAGMGLISGTDGWAASCLSINSWSR